MNIHYRPQATNSGTASSQPFAEWRLMHPEFTDEEWAEAMTEMKGYLKLAWTVYRQQHPDLSLPEEL